MVFSRKISINVRKRAGRVTCENKDKKLPKKPYGQIIGRKHGWFVAITCRFISKVVFDTKIERSGVCCIPLPKEKINLSRNKVYNSYCPSASH